MYSTCVGGNTCPKQFTPSCSFKYILHVYYPVQDALWEYTVCSVVVVLVLLPIAYCKSIAHEAAKLIEMSSWESLLKGPLRCGMRVLIAAVCML